MGYESGKKFVCESIGTSPKLKPIDYVIPTEAENQKYLNLMGRQILETYEKEVMDRRERRLQDERDKINNQRKSNQ